MAILLNLVKSLMVLCIFSLFSLVMLGQRYTTPMVTVVNAHRSPIISGTKMRHTRVYW